MAGATKWQPIETAPKDGTKIVIWSSRYDFCPIAAWHVAPDCSGWLFDDWASPCPSCDDGFIGWNEDIEDGFMPTHWIPLPYPLEVVEK